MPNLVVLAFRVMRDLISVKGLEVQCVVGVYPHERHSKQPVLVDLELELDAIAAAQSDKLADTLDYDGLTRQLSFLLENAKFRLLETAAHALCSYLLAPPLASERRPHVTRARVVLTKPQALASRGIPSVCVTRDATTGPLQTEIKTFGTVEIVFENSSVGIYRLNIAPGASIPLHIHQRMRESEMVLTSGLLCQHKPVPKGSVFQWKTAEPHVYDNPTEMTQTVLCIDMPKFDPSDEIELSSAST